MDVIDAARLQIGDTIEVDGCVARIASVTSNYQAPNEIEFSDEINDGDITQVEAGDIIDVSGLLFSCTLEDGVYLFRDTAWEIEDTRTFGENIPNRV